MVDEVDAAIMAVRQQELAQNLENGENVSLWNDMAEAVEALSYCDPEEGEELEALISRMRAITTDARNYNKAWDELLELTKSSSEIKGQIAKRIKDSGAYITYSQFSVMMSAMVEAIESEIEDKDTVARIVARFRAAVDRNG